MRRKATPTAPREQLAAVPVSTIPRANPNGTLVAVGGLLITSLAMVGNSASEVARSAAIGVGISIGFSVAFDLRKGVRNLVRADLLAVFSFYFLTLFEFFFPHPEFDVMMDAPDTKGAVRLCLLAFGGLFVGRHLSRSDQQPMSETMTRPVSQNVLLMLFWGCMALGFWHMFIAVGLDIQKVVNAMMGPRFTQPWQRGRFGDWKALLVELAMLLFLVPPLAGIIFARRRSYGFAALLGTALGLAFLFFYGFSSGTRYLFHSFIITFVIGYAFGVEKTEKKVILFSIAGVAAAMVLASTVIMLQFRNMGLTRYLEGKHWETEQTENGLAVDLNLNSIAALQRVFPSQHDYLGIEVPYLALIRVIPRALWPSKPEGLSISIEDAVGADAGWTVAATYAGEAYMAGGYIGVLVASLFFGFMTAWWNRLSNPENSQFGILIYASGFFAAVIAMRSLYFITPALLPTLCAIVGGRFLIGKGMDKWREMNHSGPRTRRPIPVR